MNYYLYDDFGRYIGTSSVKTNRSTEIQPPKLDETANWNGHEWVVVAGITGTIETSIDLPVVLLDHAKKTVSPVEFKLLFTAQERVAIKEARSTDVVVDDFFEIVEDPRLTHVNLELQSTKDALDYLVSKGLVTADRLTQILLGQIQ